MLSVVMCYICSRFTQICDCCRWFGQQQQQQDDHDAAGKTDQSSMTSSLRTMVCLLTSHQVTSPDISIRTKEVIAAARQQGLSGSLYSNMRSTALPRTDKKFCTLKCFFLYGIPAPLSSAGKFVENQFKIYGLDTSIIQTYRHLFVSKKSTVYTVLGHRMKHSINVPMKYRTVM